MMKVINTLIKLLTIVIVMMINCNDRYNDNCSYTMCLVINSSMKFDYFKLFLLTNLGNQRYQLSSVIPLINNPNSFLLCIIYFYF